MPHHPKTVCCSRQPLTAIHSHSFVSQAANRADHPVNCLCGMQETGILSPDTLLTLSRSQLNAQLCAALVIYTQIHSLSSAINGNLSEVDAISPGEPLNKPGQPLQPIACTVCTILTHIRASLTGSLLNYTRKQPNRSTFTCTHQVLKLLALVGYTRDPTSPVSC